MMGSGALVVDEMILPLVGIRLEGGKVVFVGKIAGPVPANQKEGDTDFRIYGADGSEILSARHGRPTYPALDEGTTLVVELPCRISPAEVTTDE